MYKRALMLTAATVALLSGPAFADTNVDTATTTALKTSTAGNIDIKPNGSVTITAAQPVLELDANNTTIIIEPNGTVSNKDTTSAIGVQLDASGISGGFTSGGVIDLSGTGSLKTGVLIQGTGVFTGDINLQAGSTVTVSGDNSVGLRLATNATLTGNLTMAGSIGAGSSSTTGANNNTAVELDGTVNGNILNSGNITAVGGSTSSANPNSRGLVIIGAVNGSLTNTGSIQTIGTTAPGLSGNSEGGLALAIANNITGGIYNSGPSSSADTTTPRGSIRVAGVAQAVLISPSAAGSANTTPINIGIYADGVDPGYSFLNRGNISVQPIDPNFTTTAIQFIGLSSAVDVTLQGGFFNGGTITSSTANDPHAGSATSTTALWIGSFANVPSIVNSNQSGVGTITATMGGSSALGGTATAIRIDNSANLDIPVGTGVSIINSGTISAQASTSDATVTTLQAFAIVDLSGKVNSIVNSGVISAGVSGGNTTSASVFAQAVNVASNITGGVNFQNTGAVIGDVFFGIGNDTLNVVGAPNVGASVIGNITFNGTTGGGTDVLTIGNFGTVRGKVTEIAGTNLDVTVDQGGRLTLLNDTNSLLVRNFDLNLGANLGITLSQSFNGTNVPVIKSTNTIALDVASPSNLSIGFGSFIGTGASNSNFILFDAPTGGLTISDPTNVQTAVTSAIPFLFQGSVCGNNIAFFTACGGVPPARSQLVLNLNLKARDAVFFDPAASTVRSDTFGYQLFPFVNEALAHDDELGAALIEAGLPVGGVPLTQAEGFALYNAIYADFAPDVTGASRSVAISLTDQATGPVGARQRALRMYANQPGSATLWGQEFGQRINGSEAPGGQYRNTGFGFALGLDGGDPRNGRYGGALSFYSGDTTESAPRESKTSSEYYMLSAYSDWRGRGLFFDTNVSVGYGNLTGNRQVDVVSVVRSAASKRASLFLSGGFSTGAVLASGGTSIVPQFSVDGLTMREEGYTETGGGDGVDLKVDPYYGKSLRAYLGTSIRQDLNFGDFFLQPEARVGYRYDFLADPAKLKASFASVTPASMFTLTGPDPGKGNLVAGGSLSVTTDAWSIGLNYDYIRATGGAVSQSGTISLVGRI